jgi:hypothetical protein
LPHAHSPGFVPPCIPTRAPKPPAGPDWVHEIKHDGYRLRVRREGDAVRLFTRRGYDWSGRYPAIAVTAAQLRARSFTLDEAVVCGPDGVAVFDALHRRHRERGDAIRVRPAGARWRGPSRPTAGRPQEAAGEVAGKTPDRRAKAPAATPGLAIRHHATASLAAFTGRALTIFRAGFALKVVGSLVKGLMPWRAWWRLPIAAIQGPRTPSYLI